MGLRNRVADWLVEKAYSRASVSWEFSSPGLAHAICRQPLQAARDANRAAASGVAAVCCNGAAARRLCSAQRHVLPADPRSILFGCVGVVVVASLAGPRAWRVSSIATLQRSKSTVDSPPPPPPPQSPRMVEKSELVAFEREKRMYKDAYVENFRSVRYFPSLATIGAGKTDGDSIVLVQEPQLPASAAAATATAGAGESSPLRSSWKRSSTPRCR
ncbi:uncharacterized protein IUM83_00802 [Phytophthora cinnamomi]|uniref:uncharacterized protein n=1 Tax=Phytophthora cinnamomi TaxID=4785 RepID=UPI00355AA695|nr:hypothetical protein IUM83_00802 [Phytophthora cinnamomi]